MVKKKAAAERQAEGGGGSADGGGKKSPTWAKTSRQSTLFRTYPKVLAQPRDDIGHHIGVPYDHWDYANTVDGRKNPLCALG